LAITRLLIKFVEALDTRDVPSGLLAAPVSIARLKLTFVILETKQNKSSEIRGEGKNSSILHITRRPTKKLSSGDIVLSLKQLPPIDTSEGVAHPQLQEVDCAEENSRPANQGVWRQLRSPLAVSAAFILILGMFWRFFYRGVLVPGWELIGPAYGQFLLHTEPSLTILQRLYHHTRHHFYSTPIDGFFYTLIPGLLN